MPSQERKDPYKNFRYRVEIDGIQQAGFTEVLMPLETIEVIEYREGGDPSTVRKLPGRIHHGTIVLKWGATDSMELYDCWKTVNSGDLSRRNLAIVIMDEKGADTIRWEVRDAWPSKFEPGDLKAKGNEVQIETLELTHEGITRVS